MHKDPLEPYFKDENPREYPLTWVRASANNTTLRWIVCFALVVVAIQAVANTTLAIRHEKENYLYEVNTEGTHTVKIAKAGENLRGEELLILSICRALVADIETIDQGSFQDRNKRVEFMTTPEVYEDYEDRQRPLYQKGIKRTVKLLGASRLGPKVVQVDYDITEYRDGKTATLPAKSWITYGFFDQEVEVDDRYINPIGLVATDYTPAPR